MSRNAEAALLAGAAVLAALGVSIVRVAGGESPDAQTALTFLVIALAFGSLHLAFRQWAPNASPYLLPATALLTAVGLVEIFRLDPAAAGLQRWWLLIAAGFGIATLALLGRSGTDLLARYRYLFLTAALAAFMLPLLPSGWALGGVEVNGSRLWLQLRLFDTTLVRFQPGEFGKLLLVVFLASYLASHHAALTSMTRRIGPFTMPEPRQLFPLAAAWALSLIVLVYQRDLGASLLLLAVFAAMLYAATGRAVYPLVGGGFFLLGALAAGQLFDHVQRRYDAWLRPWDDFADTGYQIGQSLFALGSGSLTGSGLGLGRPDFIPNATTDFLFAAVAEETGLAGSLAVVAAYALLVAVGFGIALRARDPYRKLLASGLTAVIAIQTILIIGGVIRLLPLTGITLPFMSYGGSALVANIVAVVVLARISHEVASCERGLIVNTPIRRLAFVLLAVLGLIVLDLTYLQVIAGPRYRDDLRNPRVAASRSSTERGPIVTREGIVLAESTADEDSAQTFTRSYPEGSLYAHTVGYTTLLFGNTGLEREYAANLSSDRDLTISGVIDAVLGREQGAEGIRLTLAHAVQQTARQALAGQPGAVVAIEPSTGEVLALYSSPSFDPTVLLGESAAAGDGLAADPLTPLRNRSIDQIFAPGSAFKVITAAAALERGVANPDTLYADPLELALPGSTAVIRNADRGTCGDGTRVDLATAFRRSCNTVFGQLGMETGAQSIGEIADAFGFNTVIPFDLPVVPSVFPTDSLVGDPPATAQSAIGQRDVQATPLQMALVAAVIANDGVLVRPYLVSERFDRDLNILAQSDPLELRRAVSPGTAAALSDMMQDVVEAGTGRAAAIPGAVVGGKTGTAEIPGSAPHAWFIGFATMDDRSIAIAVVVENGGDAGDTATGGAVAAPIARAVMEAWLRN